MFPPQAHCRRCFSVGRRCYSCISRAGAHIASNYRGSSHICASASLHRTSLVDHRGIAAMPKTMKQMKVIFKKHMKERVKVQRAASTIAAAYQDGLQAQLAAAHQAVLQAHHDLIVAAHQAALQAQHDQAVLQAQHDQLLQQAIDAHENGDTDDE